MAVFSTVRFYMPEQHFWMTARLKEHSEKVIAGANFVRAERKAICGETHIQIFIRDPAHKAARADGTVMVLSVAADELEPILEKYARALTAAARLN
jgi:hypothetical protein